MYVPAKPSCFRCALHVNTTFMHVQILAYRKQQFLKCTFFKKSKCGTMEKANEAQTWEDAMCNFVIPKHMCVRSAFKVALLPFFFLVAKKFFEAALPFSIVLFLSIGPFPLSPLSLSLFFFSSPFEVLILAFGISAITLNPLLYSRFFHRNTSLCCCSSR